jgi:hypothetical protein
MSVSLPSIKKLISQLTQELKNPKLTTIHKEYLSEKINLLKTSLENVIRKNKP